MNNKKIKNIKKIDIVFVVIVLLILFGGLLNVIFNSDEINYYENRTAYQMPKINISKMLKGEFQNEVELSFSDQLPLATILKKGYNFIHNITPNIMADIVFRNNCSNRYIKLGDSTLSFGCNKNLVYYDSYIYYAKEAFDNRIKSINETLANTTIDTYIYYIEKDTDLNFATNKKTGVYEYLKDNINSNNIYNFEINNFDEFSQYFYKTDHHWNYKGSYKAYTELVNILTDDNPLVAVAEECINDFSGSKASFSGARYFYKEPFCVYKFEYPNYTITINGEDGKYGNEDYHLNNKNAEVSYASFYGDDYGEIIIDNNNQSKPNILVIGESYDNAILKLLASHFNKTYSVDLRNYERETGNKFEYTKYLKENNINKVLLIGNIDYFKMKEFNLEV